MKTIRYIDAITECLREEMKRDQSVFILGYDVGVRGAIFGLSTGLLEEFGADRVRDTPISESAIIGCSIGSAIAGLRPIAFIHFNDFLPVCMDQIVNQAAFIRYVSGGQVKTPMVIIVAHGGGLSAGPHHSSCHEAWFLNTPGLKIVLPSTPNDAKGLLRSSIRDDNCVLFIGHPLLYGQTGDVTEGEYTIPLGKADVKREGNDVSILSFSYMVPVSLAAANTLQDLGINAEVVDLRTLVPLDRERIVDSVKKTGRAVIVEEGWKTGGVGAEIMSVVVEGAFDYLDAPIMRIAAKDRPIPFSPQMEKYILPSKGDIVNAVQKVVG